MAVVSKVETKYVLDTSQLEKGSKTAQDTVSKSSKSIEKDTKKAGIGFKALGAAAALAAVAIATKFISASLNSIDVLAKQSRTLNITINELQAFQNMAQLAGTSNEFMSMSLQKMTLNINKAKNGTGLAVKELEKMGLANEEFFALNPAQQYSIIADKVAGMSDAGDQAAASMNIFQDANGKLIDTLKGGSAAFASSQKDIDELGKSISDVDAANVEAANDAMFRVGQMMSGVTQQITVKLAPAIEWVAKLFVWLGKTLGPVFSYIGDLIGMWFNALDLFYGFVFKNVLKMKLMYLQIFDSISGTIDSFVNGALKGFRLLATGALEIVEKLPFIGEQATLAKQSLQAMGDVNISEAITSEIDSTIQSIADLEAAGGRISSVFAGIGDIELAGAPTPTAPTGEVDTGTGVVDNSKALESNFNNIVASLQSERETEQQAYVDKLVGVEEYYANLGALTTEQEQQNKLVIENIHAEHLNNINAMDEEANAAKDKLRTADLESAKTMGDDLLSITQATGGKAFAITKKISIGIAGIKAGEAIAQAVASAPFPLNVPSIIGATAQGVAAVSQIKGISARQRGGGVNPGSTVLVGEAGPELLQFGNRGGNVIPNDRLRDTGTGGDKNIYVNTTVKFDITAYDAADTQAWIDKNKDLIANGVSDSIRENMEDL